MTTIHFMLVRWLYLHILQAVSLTCQFTSLLFLFCNIYIRVPM